MRVSRLTFGSRYLRRTSRAKKRRQNDRNRLNRRTGVMTAGALRLGLNLRTGVLRRRILAKSPSELLACFLERLDGSVILIVSVCKN